MPTTNPPTAAEITWKSRPMASEALPIALATLRKSRPGRWIGSVHTISDSEWTTVTRGVRFGPKRHLALGRKLSPATAKQNAKMEGVN